MEILKNIPFIDTLLESKKAKMLAVLISLFLAREQFNLGHYELKYLTLGFCAYFLAQGLSDIGEWLTEWMSNKAEAKDPVKAEVVPVVATALSTTEVAE
jgi:hypothetical protein